MSLRSGILGLLSYGPKTGYSLKKEFDQSIGYLWTASLSQIYRELGTMEKKGYIRSSIEVQEDRPDKKVYTITDEGKSEFLRWLTDFPDNLSSVKRDDFMLRIFFGSQLKKGELIKQFERFIEQKKNYIELLNRLLASHEEKGIKTIGKDLIFWRFTAKRAVMTLETVIKWARECITELEEADL